MSRFVYLRHSVGWSFPFRLEAGGEAVVTLANPSPTEEVSYCVFLLYRGETYTYDEGKTLRPGEVKHVDLRRLRDEQIPGENDVTLPPDVTAEEIRVETLLAADRETGAVMRRLAAERPDEDGATS